MFAREFGQQEPAAGWNLDASVRLQVPVDFSKEPQVDFCGQNAFRVPKVIRAVHQCAAFDPEVRVLAAEGLPPVAPNPHGQAVLCQEQKVRAAFRCICADEPDVGSIGFALRFGNLNGAMLFPVESLVDELTNVGSEGW